MKKLLIWLNPFLLSLPFLFSLYMKGGHGYGVVLPLVLIISILWFYFLPKFYFDRKIDFRPLFLFLGYIFLYFVSWLFSQVFSYGFNEILIWGICFIYTLMFVYLDFNDLKKTYGLFIFYTVISCLVGFIAYVYLPFPRFVGNFFSIEVLTSLSPNAYSDILVFLIPVCVYFLYESKSKTEIFLSTFSTIIILSGLFLTGSRGGIVGFLFSGFILVLYFILIRNWKFILRLIGIFVVSIILVLGFNKLKFSHQNVTYVTPESSFSDRLKLEDVSKTQTLSEREIFWETSVSMIKESPFVGLGPKSFYFYSTRFLETSFQRTYHPHNIVMKIWAENGIFTLLTFIFLLGFLSKFCVVRFFFEEKKSDLSLFLFVAILGVVTHQIIDYTWHFSTQVLLFGSFVGGIISVTKGSRGFVFSKVINVFVILIFILSISEFYGVYAYKIGDMKNTQLLIRTEGRDIGLDFSKYAKNNPLDPFIDLQSAKNSFLNKDYKTSYDFLMRFLELDPYSEVSAFRLLLELIRVDEGKEEEGLFVIYNFLSRYVDSISKNENNAILDPKTSEVEELINDLQNYFSTTKDKANLDKIKAINENFQYGLMKEKNRLNTIFPEFVKKNLPKNYFQN